MHPHEPLCKTPWQAHLTLAYACRDGRTVPVERTHRGPWLVQKALYPEGPAVCHHILLHPPGGMAGGDELTLDVRVESAAAALLTTPGAGKWYRSLAATARQTLRFEVAAGGLLEWLPQENILFDAALAQFDWSVELSEDAAFLGWEITCLGRTAAGESFQAGSFRCRNRVRRNRVLLWLEQGRLEGGSPLLQATVGWNTQPVSATLVASGPGLDGDRLAACRALSPRTGSGSLTPLPGLWVGRYLGPDAAEARAYLTRLWQVLRPALAGRTGSPPRIWAT